MPKLHKVVVVWLIILLAFVTSSFYWYWHERSKPGGDAVRQGWLKRRSCEAEARTFYEKCIRRVNATSP